MPPTARKPRARSYDPRRTRAAVAAQLDHLRDAVRTLETEELALSVRHGRGTVGDLVAGLARSVEHLCRDLQAPAPPRQEATVAQWAATARLEDDGPGEPEKGGGDPVARLEEAVERYGELLPGAPSDRLLPTGAGAMRLDDALVTRCVQLAVAADDLAAATGREVRHDRQALATAVRLLADALAAAAPGGSVEVRVPPFAVVQCVAGPRHTRGTPPNVVETAPLPWLRLATGRTTWAEALDAAEVSASGERADLAPYLPILT